MNKIFTYIISGLIIAGLVYCLGYALGYTKSEKKCLEKEPTVITIKEPVVIHDTITDIKWKNKYIDHYDTAYFTCLDTITDTVKVEVPIYKYIADTTLQDSTRVKAQFSGYNVTLDSLEVSYQKEKTTVIIQPTEKKRIRWGFGIALGFGFIYGE